MGEEPPRRARLPPSRAQRARTATPASLKKAAAENKADITVDIVKVTSRDFRFVVSNQGLATATDVDIEIDSSSLDNPMVEGERAAKLPFPRLDPGQSFTLIAALHLRSAMQYSLHLTWKNPGGRIERRDAHVAL